MVRILSVLSTTQGSSIYPAPGWESNYPGNGLYMSSPNKYTVWQAGQHVTITWTMDKTDRRNLDTLNIKLVNSQRTYIVAEVVSAQHGFADGLCNTSGDSSQVCGMWFWKLPEDVVPDKYKVVVVDSDNGKVIENTDLFSVEGTRNS
ncbi:uncharacterized protein SPSC_06456 [Sporisorium scitamineum]|uniref:Yeast cell wall synthesis Kre9/Knh1-like N-terminal domain-containing protein n=1 Tax=Sporisorium scitamineum TaxID=49012 RepID=A0A0F7S293_9BASI|nr:hypothetical protein [Sporisorium scitamineum]CDU26262.1 uncharacterized protein SPSC_06456 [Sporisorium scitamineum]